MYLVPLKTMLVEAIKLTFDNDYPETDFRDIRCSLEYPLDKQDYPGIWVDYEDTKSLQTAGVDHMERVDIAGSPEQRYRRWEFAGYASFTIVALSSLERDRLFDELVRVIAFGDVLPATYQFRTYVESNDFIACNFDWDQVEVRGNSATPGTPWGTDEIIYEKTINMEVIGEFVSDKISGSLALLSAINVLPADVYFTDPAPDDTDEDQPSGQGLVTDWH